MKSSILSGLIFLILISFAKGIAQEKTLPNVSIKDTEVLKMKSNYVENMEYDIHISLPVGYTESNQKYPVVYYTDAYFWGGIVIETYRMLRAFNEIPPMILIGISYDHKKVDDVAAIGLRARDLTPTSVPNEKIPDWLKPFTPISGGAESFLSFIEFELIPEIESNYNADSSNRGLFGYSYGGLFGSYVLFKKPDLFQKYLLGAPTLIWDNYYVLKEEDKQKNTNRTTQAKVFAPIGSEDFADLILSWTLLRDRLNSRNYKNLDFQYMILDGDSHTAAIPAVYSRAFRVLYGNN